MSLLILCSRFFLTGLFAIGGGLAAIPIMEQLIVKAGIIEEKLFYNMIAVSESTPGPIGVNIATYIGFERFGVLGGILTTLALTLPSFVIILILARNYSSFIKNTLVKDALYGIRATVVGLIAYAAWKVLCVTVITPSAFLASPSVFTLFDFRQLVIFAVIFALYHIFKKHPILYILLGAVCGIVFL